MVKGITKLPLIKIESYDDNEDEKYEGNFNRSSQQIAVNKKQIGRKLRKSKRDEAIDSAFHGSFDRERKVNNERQSKEFIKIGTLIKDVKRGGISSGTNGKIGISRSKSNSLPDIMSASLESSFEVAESNLLKSIGKRSIENNKSGMTRVGFKGDGYLDKYDRNINALVSPMLQRKKRDPTPNTGKHLSLSFKRHGSFDSSTSRMLGSRHANEISPHHINPTGVTIRGKEVRGSWQGRSLNAVDGTHKPRSKSVGNVKELQQRTDIKEDDMMKKHSKHWLVAREVLLTQTTKFPHISKARAKNITNNNEDIKDCEYFKTFSDSSDESTDSNDSSDDNTAVRDAFKRHMSLEERLEMIEKAHGIVHHQNK
eukprot:gene3247-3728_t